jgi:hypothetical protein
MSAVSSASVPGSEPRPVTSVEVYHKLKERYYGRKIGLSTAPRKQAMFEGNVHFALKPACGGYSRAGLEKLITTLSAEYLFSRQEIADLVDQHPTTLLDLLVVSLPPLTNAPFLRSLPRLSPSSRLASRHRRSRPTSR